jgi:hypothetical protein
MRDAEAEAQAVRDRAMTAKAEAEAAGFDNVGDYWRWRAAQRKALADG